MAVKGFLDPNIFIFNTKGDWIKKRCSKCKKILLKEEFAPDSRKGCGRTAQCRKCRNRVYNKNESKRMKSEAHREKKRIKNKRTYDNYTDERREEIRLHNNNYHKNRLLTDETFRLHHLKRCKNWWENTEKGKLAQKTKNHNQRMRRKNIEGIITSEMIKRVEDNNRRKYGTLTCEYCKSNVESGYDLDHKTAVINGGKNIYRNLCISCEECNASKGSMSKSEFLKSGRLKRILDNLQMQEAS